MKIALIISASLAVAVPAAYAGDQGDPVASCDGSTQAMVECINAKAAQSDKRMTTAYQTLMKKAELTQHDQLRNAQRLWIQYRDANCMYYALGDGSISRIDAPECLRRLTEARRKETETMTGR